jgi:sulfonate transport system substrate-binding protein
VVDFPRAQDLHGLITAVTLAGLSPSDVKFVDIPGHDFEQREADGSRPKFRHVTVEALLDGTVDVIYAKGAPSAALVEAHGLRTLLDINAHPDAFVRVNTGTPRPVTVNRALALERPDIVARYLATLLKAAEWAKTHPNEVVDAVSAETGSTRENVRRGYGPELHLHFDVQLSSQYTTGLRLQKDFLRDWGFLKSDFDFDGWVVSEPLLLARELVGREGTQIG